MKWREPLGSGLFFIGTAVACNTPRSAASTLFLAIGLMGLGVWLTRKESRVGLVLVGLLARSIALVGPAYLSEDYLRFVWDGQLWLAGYHPLDFVPQDAPSAFAASHNTLLAGMNSPAYFTVYPPLSQLVFVVASAFAKTGIAALTVLKSILLLCEVGVIALLLKLTPRADKRAEVYYALTPLAIIEVCGNVHFESLALLGVLLALYGFRQNKPWLSGAGLAIGVLTKLVPALCAPAFLLAWLYRERGSGATNLDWQAAIRFTTSVTVLTLIGMAAFLLPADLTSFGESLDLYFRNFEFNGSLYTVAAALGEWYKGWNWIAVVGPSMSALALLSILLISWVGVRKKWPLPEVLLWCFAAYIATATTVHPWYVLYLVGLGALTRYRWPMVLSVTVFLSYLAYGENPIAVPGWALALEYLPTLGLALYEIKAAVAKSIYSEKNKPHMVR